MPYTKQAFYLQLIRVLILLQLPFRSVEHLQLRHFIYLLNPEAQMPSATTVHMQLQKRSDNIKDQLLVDLPPDTKISLALDC